MDPVTASIFVILGKYALDKGAVLVKESGPVAKQVAGTLFDKVVGYFKEKDDTKVLAEGYEQKPSGYEESMKDQVADALKLDEAFKKELEALIAQFKEAEKKYQANSTVLTASGDNNTMVAGDGNTVVGARGVFVKGDVSGNIITGDNNKINEQEES